jgi:hypothetical protein
MAALSTIMQYRLTDRLNIVILSGCVLAAAVGAIAASRYGVLVSGTLIGILFFAIAVTVYFRDPIAALIGLWLFEVFNAPLSTIFGYSSSAGQAVRQADEVLVLLFVSLTILQSIRANVRLPPLRFVLPGIGVAVFGLLGAIVHGVPMNVSLSGALLGLKLWIMIAAVLVLPWKLADSERIYTAAMIVGVFVAIVGIADHLTHGAVTSTLHISNITIVREGAYRSGADHSIFPTPGEYSLFMSLLFALVAARLANKFTRVDLMLAILFAGSVILSLRLRGFLSLAAVVLVVVAVQAATKRRGALIALIGGLLLIGVAYNVEENVITKQFSTYSSSESSARSRLYATGEQIASTEFPLGAGFGRFASYPSRIYYSPVYYQYGLNWVVGLSPTSVYPNFIDDTSWPSVIGETGYGGFAAYVIGLIVLILAAIRGLRVEPDSRRWIPLAGLCTIAVFLVDSAGDATLFSWLAATTLAMILGPVLVGPLSSNGTSLGYSSQTNI